MARRLGLGGEALDEIGRAAQLHDIGKVGIPDAILNKPATLTDSEWEFMQQHTILGERILHGAPALRPVARLVRASHERWDGAGYPDGLGGEEIPLGARIVSVCDAYEAMTSQSHVPRRRVARDGLPGAATRRRQAVRPGGRRGFPGRHRDRRGGWPGRRGARRWRPRPELLAAGTTAQAA